MISKRLSFAHWGPDLAGGLTTAIISLPLALAFGVASGAGPQAGLYGAVLVGLFAALFGSSTRLISEPTGPMTVIMTAVIANLVAANPEQGMAMAFTVVMVAGLFQILLGALKLGQFITLMPYAVISGFMSGIGVLLVVMQLPGVLGHASPGGGVLGVLQALPGMLQNLKLGEILLALFAMALLWGMPASWRKRCPPQLLALIIGTVLSLIFWDTGDLRRIGEIPMGLPDFQIPTFSPAQSKQILLDGLVLGLLGCIDTLLTAMIADSLTREHHDSNRELLGQGIANLVSGFCGGLPGAGATMGTVVNIQIGAKSILAGVIRALLLLTVLLGAAPLMRSIPMAILAAIALNVGVNILDWSFLKRVHNVSRSSTIMMWVVLILTVFVDLVVAVGVGVFIANLLTIKRLSDLHSQNVKAISTPDVKLMLTPEEEELMDKFGTRVLLFHMSGPMIFGVAKALAREQSAMKHAEVLIVDLQDVPLLGVTVSLGIENMVKDALNQGARVWIVGARGATRERMEKFEVLTQEGVFEAETRLEALQAEDK